MTDDHGYDIHFYWDPVCPFAWITSRWITKIVEQRDYRVDWRFISLRIVNEHIDYDAHFPPEYEEGHNAGLRLLRVAAKARADHGRDVMGPLYTAIGSSMFDVEPADANRRATGTPAHLAPILDSVGLPASLIDALDDESWDVDIAADTHEARTMTGKDVGTPIIQYDPPDGPGLFGPVISRVPSDERALELWDHVLGLARFPGFTELKRSLRERPALRAFGIDPDEPGIVEDWHAGSRRPKHP